MSDENNFSLINFDGASDVVIKLLDMIEKAVGWTIIPKGTKADFKEGLAIYKESIMNDDTLSGMEKGAKISTARKELKQYINQCKIISYATENIKDDAKMDIDDDWLLLFFEYTKNISDEDVQKIWGKILAEKCNDNTNINRKFLNILSTIDREVAVAFGKLCKVTISCKSGIYGRESEDYMPFNIPIVIRNSECNDFFDKYLGLNGPTYQAYIECTLSGREIALLEEVGLIEKNDNDDFTYKCDDNVVIMFDNKKYDIKLNTEQLIKENDFDFEDDMYKPIKLGYIKFTIAGEKLFKILDIQYCSKFENIFYTYLIEQGFVLNYYK